MREGAEKNLYIAWLYLYVDITWKGIIYLLDAAETLSKSPDKNRAFIFYDRVLQYFSENTPDKKNVDYFLESVLGSLQASRMMINVEQRIPILSKAWKYAKRFEKWEYLSKINLRLSRALAAAGYTKKAIEYIDKTLEIVTREGVPSAKILSALCTSQILF